MFAKEKQNYRCVVSTNPSDDSRKPITEAERMKTQTRRWAQNPQSKAKKKCSTINILGKARKRLSLKDRENIYIYISYGRSSSSEGAFKQSNKRICELLFLEF